MRATKRYNRRALQTLRYQGEQPAKSEEFLDVVPMTYRELIGSWPGTETDAELRDVMEQPRWGMGE